MSKEQTPTPHIEAKYGDFAKTIVMPGDPKRAKLIVDNFVDDAKLVTEVRGIVGYTGTYKGKEVSVMASGMGFPSIGIYTYELFNFYDVDNIIRVGTAGAYVPQLHLKDMIIIQGCCLNSSYAEQYNLPGKFSPIANWDLCRFAAEAMDEKGANYEVGNMLSSDVFYEQGDYSKQWADMNVLGVEMETGALYCNAAQAHKRALAITTVTDSFVYPEKLTAEERQTSLMEMLECGMETAFKADALPSLKK